MAQVDTAFIVGVIREKEKGMLQEDEYVRIFGAPTAEDAVKALVDTPYGVHLEKTDDAFAAITSHLESEIEWLTDYIQDQNITHFLTARYDGLHIARALAKYQAEEARVGRVSSPTSISHEVLSSTIWDDTGYEDLPEDWREFVGNERAETAKESWNLSDLLKRTRDQVVKIMEQTAQTNFMRAAAEHAKHHLSLDEQLRQNSDTSMPAWMKQEMVEPVQQRSDATEYEKTWDEQLLQLIRTHRWEPIGYDPIVAYWLGKELEARTVRLILSAKLGGLSKEKIAPLKRSLYLSTV